MVTRRRLRSFLNTLGLYVTAALLVGYFAVNAYTGNHGLKAKQDIDRQMTALSAELNRLHVERVQWQRRVNLLKPENIDPDMLDERARALLDDVGPDEVTLLLGGARAPAPRGP